MPPLILPNENEFIGCYLALLKWLAVFKLVFMLRTRFDGKESAPQKRLKIAQL